MNDDVFLNISLDKSNLKKIYIDYKLPKEYKEYILKYKCLLYFNDIGWINKLDDNGKKFMMFFITKMNNALENY